jgi:predicted HicB family RNase H-like nuclease
MQKRYQKLLQDFFRQPTSGTDVFADIEALILALGGEVLEREGSRVQITLKSEQWRCHLTHPGKEAKVPGGGSERAFGACGSETMNTMTYKGYTARIDFDERDSIFVGRVLGVRPIISFHGETVTELRAPFIAAVDDYLEDCAAQGIPPEKPASGNLMLRVPPEVHGAVLVAAQSSGKSLNQWAAEVLKKAANR